MLNKILKSTGYFIFILVVLFVCARFIDVSLGGIYDGPRAPYIQSLASDSVILRWNTKKPQQGVVFIGEQPYFLKRVFKETKIDDEHEVRLTGLKPATKYFYRVGTASRALYSGPSYWFKTALTGSVQATSAIRFWVTGDQGQAGVIQSQVRDAMLAWSKQHPLQGRDDFNFWLTTGDNAYRSGTNSQFQRNFFKPYAKILKNTPVWPVYGNHDARRWSFFNIFSFPAKAEAGGVASNTEKYYSFDYGELHVIILDTQSSRIQKNSKMLRWLKKDLAQTKAKWRVVAFHHPPYTKGSHDSDNLADSRGRMRNVRQYVLPVLEQAAVDVVVSGHSHMYERSWFMSCHYGFSDTFSTRYIQDGLPQGDVNLLEIRQQQKGLTYKKAAKGLGAYSGTVYITLGSSAKLDQGDLNHPAMPVSLGASGSMVFDIVGNQLTARFIDKDGQVLDSFGIKKSVMNAAVARQQCSP